MADTRMTVFQLEFVNMGVFVGTFMSFSGPSAVPLEVRCSEKASTLSMHTSTHF